MFRTGRCNLTALKNLKATIICNLEYDSPRVCLRVEKLH